MKPSLKLIIIAGAAIIGTLAMYLAWHALTAAPGMPEEPPTIGATLPMGGATAAPASNLPTVTTSPSPTLKRVSESPAFGIWLDAGTGEMYYLTPEGKAFAAKEGPDLEISKQPVGALNRMEPSPSGKSVLAAFGDPSAPRWGIFSVIDTVWHPLPREILNAAWGKSDDELIVLMESGENRALARANVSKTPPAYQTILNDVRLNDVRLTFRPSPEALFIAELPSARVPSRVWLLDLSARTPTINTIFSPERGLSISAPRGSSLLFTVTGGEKFRILDNVNFGVAFPVPFSSFPEKCGVSYPLIFCFSPRNLSSQTLLPDDYFEGKVFTTDTLYVMNTETETVTAVLESGADGVPPIDAKNPAYAGGSIYFINRYDNYVYELKL